MGTGGAIAGTGRCPTAGGGGARTAWGPGGAEALTADGPMGSTDGGFT